MPEIAANGVYRLCIYCHDGDQASVNTIHLGAATLTGLGATFLDVASDYDSIVAPAFKPLLANGAVYDGVSIQNVSPLPIYARVFANSHAGVGTGGTDTLPRQTSGLVSLYSQLAGRKNRGRLYVPFPAVASNTATGTPNAGYVTGLGLIGTNVFTPILVTRLGGGGTVTMIPLISNRLGTVTTPVYSTVARNKWATQRRRGSYGRVNSSPI